MSLAIAPVGGYLAVTGRWSQTRVAPAGDHAAVATWVAGFDIFYALPDEDFDRQGRTPERGRAPGRPPQRAAGESAARSHHSGPGPLRLRDGVRQLVLAGVVVAAGILAYEHQLVRADDISRVDQAFFTMNAVMSVTVFAFALVDRLV